MQSYEWITSVGVVKDYLGVSKDYVVQVDVPVKIH